MMMIVVVTGVITITETTAMLSLLLMMLMVVVVMMMVVVMIMIVIAVVVTMSMTTMVRPQDDGTDEAGIRGRELLVQRFPAASTLRQATRNEEPKSLNLPRLSSLSRERMFGLSVRLLGLR